MQERILAELFRLCCVQTSSPFSVVSNSAIIFSLRLNVTSPRMTNSGLSGNSSRNSPLVHGYRAERRASYRNLARYPADHPDHLLRFSRKPVADIPRHRMRNRTGADQQHDLADQSHLGLFFPVFRTGKVEFAQPQELLHDFPVNGPLSRARYDAACVHVVFLPRELPEFARKYRHGDQPLEFFLVIDILIVLFDPEYRRSARRKTGPEEVMPAVSRERHPTTVVPAGNQINFSKRNY